MVLHQDTLGVKEKAAMLVAEHIQVTTNSSSYLGSHLVPRFRNGNFGLQNPNNCKYSYQRREAIVQKSHVTRLALIGD